MAMSMNDMIRYGGRGAATGKMPADSGGSQDFTVLKSGDKQSGDGLIYEPDPEIDGAWLVYPPGVPCDESATRIERTTPAATKSDFDAMQQAIDDAEGESSPDTESASKDTGEGY